MVQDCTLHEQMILLSIYRLGDDAYGVPIRANVMEVTGRNLHFGTLYNTLDKLVKKGLVEIRRGEPTRERGGRSRIYYFLTSSGMESLQKARELQSALWHGIPDVLFGETP
jgi:DNA-binding PadR family transcriptional regulator